MNKTFLKWVKITLLCSIFAGLFLKIGKMEKSSEWNWIAGLFTSLFCCSLIWAVSIGTFDDTLKVRQRNIMRIILLIFTFHVIAFFSIGGTQSMVESFRASNVDKFLYTISNTWETSVNLKNFLISIVKLNPTNLEGISANYLVFLIFSLVASYKLLFSWGWICVSATTSAITAWIYLAKYCDPDSSIKKGLIISSIGMISVAGTFVYKNWRQPKTT